VKITWQRLETDTCALPDQWGLCILLPAVNRQDVVSTGCHGNVHMQPQQPAD